MMAVMELGAEGTLAAVHREHYRSLVRLAALLGDRDMAEEIVQDAFVRAYIAGDRVRDALPYVRQAVINGARSSLRRRRVRERLPFHVVREAPSQPDRTDLIAALRRLPPRQRECLVLRYYADLSQAEIAATLGVAPGTVKTHTSRGLAALGKLLEETS